MSDARPLHVLGIAGSLRAASFNRALLRAARELAPAGMEIAIFEGIGALPLFNEDVEKAGDPEPVRALKAAIREADGLLVVTPEYNYSIPGVLKNAVDWASRAPERVLNDKPAAILGATPGMGGTIRSQDVLRRALDMAHVMHNPEVFVARAHEKFDAEGRLTDETTRKLVGRLLAAFADWIPKFRR